MNIDILNLLHTNKILMLFVVLVIGLSFGKMRLGGFQFGSSIGVLFTAILFGSMGFTIDVESLNIGFMVFIFCVGIEAGPNFVSVFLRDGKSYLSLSLIVLLVSFLILFLAKYFFNYDLGILAGILSGSMTATPFLIGAKEALNNGLSNISDATVLKSTLDNLSLYYVVCYLVGLISLLVLAKLMPLYQKNSLEESSIQIAQERGLGNIERKVYLPIIRAYKVDNELVEWTEGKNLQELGIYRKTGCYIEKIMRNGILANPSGNAILQEGDKIALVGYPDSHARLDPCFRNGKEVFDRELLNLKIIDEEIVVKNNNIIDKELSELNLADYGCFLNTLKRVQIEMPLNKNIKLAKGDVLQISGEKARVLQLADKIGFIAVHSQMADLIAFCSFFVLGLFMGVITLSFGHIVFGFGNTSGLLISGIILGAVRASHPTFGYVPQSVINTLKELGLIVFMVGIGISAGGSLLTSFNQINFNVIFISLAISIIPVLVAYLFGAYVLKMNRALLFGAIIGARTCAPAMDMINEHAKSTVPALGYAGTYAISNIFLTIAGTLIVIFD